MLQIQTEPIINLNVVLLFKFFYYQISDSERILDRWQSYQGLPFRSWTWGDCMHNSPFLVDTVLLLLYSLISRAFLFILGYLSCNLFEGWLYLGNHSKKYIGNRRGGMHCLHLDLLVQVLCMTRTVFSFIRLFLLYYLH